MVVIIPACELMIDDDNSVRLNLPLKSISAVSNKFSFTETVKPLPFIKG